MSSAIAAHRKRVMPIAERFELDDVIDACAEHAALTNLSPMWAITLLAGINDSDDDARALADRVLAFALRTGRRPRISVLDYNAIGGHDPFVRSPRLAAFREVLSAAGLPSHRRYSGGSDVAAACGQLAATIGYLRVVHQSTTSSASEHRRLRAVRDRIARLASQVQVDKPTGLLRLDRVLYSAVHYPANYGFIPRTHADDGDPLDVLVLMHEPVAPLTIIRARPLGGLRMVDEKGGDDKIVAVCIDDPSFDHYGSLHALPPHISKELDRFFRDYKALEGKRESVTVGRCTGRRRRSRSSASATRRPIAAVASQLDRASARAKRS
jgi:inorganic pyrophosphatase